LFPANVQDKVLKGAYDGQDDKSNVIASFFPETTVMFADISGFTAWASTREPAQVFQLLETIYGAFDELARRKQIFKVETVGYVMLQTCSPAFS
jgi:class 3 adenylate cyclase